jgi:lipopolysaccharide export system protein LptC
MTKSQRAMSMDRLRDAHTRRVRILKVTLPLLALGILSSLFLFSRTITMEGALPFAEVDIADRLREPKMTNVRIATAADNGSLITLSAASVTPIAGGQVSSRAVEGRIKSAAGTEILLNAAEILYDDSAATAALMGGVNVTSAGYDMRAQALDVAMQSAQVVSRGAVSAVGPLGQMDAGQMTATQTESGAVIVFTSGVQVVYDPQN